MPSTTANTTVGWEKASVDADLTLSIPNGDESRIPIFFRKIPQGSFQMGSRAGHNSDEEPIHTVQISSFYMGTFPVTQEQWQAVVEACQQQGLLDGDFDPSPSHLKTGELAHLRPVENVSWHDVKEWMAGANELLKRKDGIRVKRNGEEDSAGRGTPLVLSLPTEAEWEYACRAGTETEYYTGDGEAALAEAGWYGGNSCGGAHPVGEQTPNAFSLYDMHGKVSEWCEDAWDPHGYKKRPSGVRDPRVTAEMVGSVEADAGRVSRGGSSYGHPLDCRSANRFALLPGDRYTNIGFRVCLRFDVDSSPGSTDDEAAPATSH